MRNEDATFRAMNISPRPLVLAGGRVVLSWSMKSACTHAVLWGFNVERLLPAARYFHHWPHKFRSDVYYRSAGYQTARTRLIASPVDDRVLIRVTRDPVGRLVSIFRHVCGRPFLWPELRDKCGIDVPGQGISLQDFDRFLARCNLNVPSDANPHICLQYHPIWDEGFGRIVTLNIDTHDMDTHLRKIEQSLGLRSNWKQLDKTVQGVAERHYLQENADVPDVSDLAAHRFKPEDTRRFPKAGLLALPFLKDMAHRHYGKDFAHVGSHDTADEIFAAEAPT